VLQRVGEVEGRRIESRPDFRICLDELLERDPLVPRAESMALDEPVGIVAREAGGHERREDALRENEAVRRLEVRPHPCAVHHEPVHEPSEAVEHVVEREEGVGNHDALGARVRDVALVPERDVLEADGRGSANDAREAADPLGYNGVALVRHGRGALLALAEGLLHLPDLRPREVADLGREPFQGSRAESERGQEGGMAVAWHDLRGGGLGQEAEPLAGNTLHLGVAAAVGAHGPGELADARAGERRLEAVAGAVELERPTDELRPEGDGLRVNAVCPTDHDRLALLVSAAGDRREGLLDALEHEEAGLAQLERERRIEDVGRGQSVVEPATLLAEVGGNGVHECGDVVLSPLLDLRHALRRGRHRPVADRLDGLPRYSTDLGPALERGELYLEPASQAALVRPDALHGRAGVARDHRPDSREAGGARSRKPHWKPARILIAMMNRRAILLVEDETSISEPLAAALEGAGFNVTVAATAAAGLDEFKSRQPDLVLLDVMLPDGDGKDVLREIRAGSRTPVVMLTARGEEMDRVLGLELGADDYVTKPFSAAELVARIRAVLRRSSDDGGGAEEATLAVGDVAMNLDTHTVTRAGADVELTVKEFELLRVLLQNAGKLVRRDVLVSEVWDPNWFGSTKTVDVHVSALRRKLGDDPAAPRYIHTVRGVGFRFASVTELGE
jgi:two-component system, OmpR family, response regulator RegX3